MYFGSLETNFSKVSSCTVLCPGWAYLAHAVVCELDVSFVVQQHIVQLQVAVDDRFLVQEVEGDADLCSVEPEIIVMIPDQLTN